MNNINNTKDKEIIIIGKENVVSCFRFLGFKTLYINEKNALDKFLQLKQNIENYGIIYITEDFYNILKEEIEKISQKVMPAIVLIPNNSGSQNIAYNMMKKTVEQAAGSDILSNKN